MLCFLRQTQRKKQHNMTNVTHDNILWNISITKYRKIQIKINQHKSNRHYTTSMTSKLAALAKILLLPSRSAARAFVRPLQRIIFGTEPQENDDEVDEEEQLEEQQQQNKGILLEALMARSGGNLNSNSNYTKNHKEEQVGGPITDPIAKHQLREVRNDYYRSAASNSNNNSNSSNNNNDNSNFNFNTQRQDDQDTPPASSSWSSVSSPTSSSQDVVVSRTTPDVSTIPVGDEYLYLAQ